MEIPFSEDAEKAYLGLLLQGNPMLFRVDAKAFYSSANRKVFESILKTYSSGRKPDLISVKATLQADNALDSIGGQGYLLELAEYGGYDSTLQETYGKTVMDMKARRDLITLSEKISKSASSTTPVNEILKSAVDGMDKVGESAINDDSGAEFIDLYEELFEFIEQTSNKKDGEPIGYPTGIPLIDKNCEGLQPGTVTRLNAYSNVGKTRLAVSIVANLLRNGVSVAFFSTEVVKKYFATMIVSAYYGVSYDEVKHGNVPDMSELNEKKLRFYDDKFSLSEIVYLSKKHKPQVVVIDFAQNIDAGYPGDEYKNMSAYAREIQKFAIQNKVAVFDLSQVSNEGAKEGRGSQIINSKGSGALVASADVALLLTREYVQGTTEFFLNLDIKKNKYGGYGGVELLPDFKRLRFVEYMPEFRK